MNLNEFLSYKDKGYTHIPVYEEFVADLISPLYVFSNFYNQKNTSVSYTHLTLPTM